MLLFGILGAACLFTLGCAAAYAGRRRAQADALRAAAAYEELETRLAKLGTGIGVGA